MEDIKVLIVRHPNGTYDVQSGCCGPVGTLLLLRDAIAQIEKAAMEAEAREARTRIQPAILADRMAGALDRNGS